MGSSIEGNKQLATEYFMYLPSTYVFAVVFFILNSRVSAVSEWLAVIFVFQVSQCCAFVCCNVGVYVIFNVL